MRTKLQIALDDIEIGEAIKLVSGLTEWIDIVETGTPFMMEYGMEAVRCFRDRFPQLEILCDAKIMDAGGYEAGLAYSAGADYVTVLGVTDDSTIESVVEAAKESHKKVMVDMLCVPDVEARIVKLEKIGVDVLAVHTGVDQQKAGRTPLDDLKELKRYARRTAVAVAGGICEDTVGQYLVYKPEIVIVGGGILHAKDPGEAARRIALQIREGVK